MSGSSTFETRTVRKSEVMERPEVLLEIRSFLEKPEVKVVDVRRHKDQLTIVFRRVH